MLNEFWKLILNCFLKVFFICLIIAFIVYIFFGFSISEGFILGSFVFISSMMILTKMTDFIFVKSLNSTKKFPKIFSFFISFILKTFILISLICLVFIIKANILAFLLGVLCSLFLFIFMFICNTNHKDKRR